MQPRSIGLSLAVLSFGVVVIGGLAYATPVRADGPYEGQWREGEMRIDVAVESWGGDCGARPQSTTAPAGGTFRISQQGDQLTFHLPRERTTSGCWSENRAVRRVSSSSQAGTWRIVCRTPPSDSRSEAGTYTIQALGNDRLSFRDVSRYDWQLNESRCLATITTTQAFTRVGQAPETVSNPTPTNPQPTEPRQAACTPGPAARIVLRPTEANVPPDGEQCFSARAVDAQGCPLRTRVEFAVSEGAGRIEGRCFRASNAEGRARVTARAGDLTATATLDVRAMDLSDWIARRTETGSVGGGADEDAWSETAARVSTRDPDAIDWTWPIVGLLAALAMIAIAAFMLSRRRSKPAIGGLPDVSIADDPPRPSRPSSTRTAAVPKGEDRICPTCRRGYPPGTERCAKDGTTLLPYRDFVASTTGEHTCPVCGTKYPAHVKFCGKDGATLGSPNP